jgi:hypothetical protein
MLWLVFHIWILVQDLVGPEIDQNLVENVRLLAPRLNQAQAEQHVRAATRAATSALDSELLLAVAYVESRYDSQSVSRVEDDRRVAGAWRSRSPAGSGPRFCGVMQTQAHHSWASCVAMRDVDIAYLVGAAELRDWLRLARSDLPAALRGHGCGFYGFTNPCRYYDARVLKVRRRLARRTVL